MSVEVHRLSDTIGAEIRGVDLSKPLDPGVARTLLDAWHDHILLLFRGQNLTDDQFRASASWLGELGKRTMPQEKRAQANFDPHIMMLSNLRDSDGKPMGSLGDGEIWFHHDNSFVPNPHKATALYCMACAVNGGHTVFANGYLSYEALPERLRQAVEGRRVLQVYGHDAGTGRPDLATIATAKHCWQPAVVVNPDTGRKALYLDRLMTAQIEGYSQDESEALINSLLPYVERYDYEHVWSVNDYVMWDNRCSAHMRTDFDNAGPRVLKRLTVIGDALIPATSRPHEPAPGLFA